MPRVRTGSHRVRLALLIFSIAGMNIGYTAILPFVPQIQRELRLSPVLLTLFLLAFPAGKIVTQAALGGRLTDRWGPASAGAVAWAAAGVGMTVVAFAGTPVGLLGGPVTAIVGRLVWGVGDGLGVPAIYRAAGQMAEHYDVPVARLRAAVGAGAVLTLAAGPAVAGGVHLFAGFRAVLAIGAALSLVGAAISMYAMRIPETGQESAEPVDTAERTERAERAARPGWLLPLAAFGFFELVLNMLFAATEPLVPLYSARHTSDPAGRASFILTAGLGVWVLVTFGSGRGPDWLRNPGSGVASLVLLGASCLALSGLGSLPVGLAAIAVFMLAQGHGYLVARTGIDVYTDATGTMWGRFNAIGDLGFLIGPLAAMTAYSNVGGLAFPVLGAVTVAAAAAYALLCGSLRRQFGPAPGAEAPPPLKIPEWPAPEPG